MSARIRDCDPEARMIIGVMFRILALKIQPRVLRSWLDWQGCVENVHRAIVDPSRRRRAR